MGCLSEGRDALTPGLTRPPGLGQRVHRKQRKSSCPADLGNCGAFLSQQHLMVEARGAYFLGAVLRDVV